MSHGSPVVVFLADRGHSCLWNFNFTVPIDVIRVKSYVNCLFDPMCVVMCLLGLRFHGMMTILKL